MSLKPPPLRAIIAVLMTVLTFGIVAILLLAPLQSGARDAAVPLVTLLIAQFGNIIRSLFREPASPAIEKQDAMGDKA